MGRRANGGDRMADGGRDRLHQGISTKIEVVPARFGLIHRPAKPVKNQRHRLCHSKQEDRLRF